MSHHVNRTFSTLAGLLRASSGSISVFPTDRGGWAAQTMPPTFNKEGELVMGRSQDGPTLALVDLNHRLNALEWEARDGSNALVIPKGEVVIPLVSATAQATIPVPESLVTSVGSKVLSSAIRMYVSEVMTENRPELWEGTPVLDRQRHIEVAVRLPKGSAEAWESICSDHPEARWEVSARLVRTLASRVRKASTATLTHILEERKAGLEKHREMTAPEGTTEVFECPTEVSGPEVRYVPTEQVPPKVEQTRAQKAWETRRQNGNGGRPKEVTRAIRREAAKGLTSVRVPDEMPGRELSPALRAWAAASEARRAEVLQAWASTREEIPYHRTRPTTLAVADDAVRDAFMAAGSITERGSILFAFYKESQR